MDKTLEHLLSTIIQSRREQEEKYKEEDVIKVSDTVSVAASVYETVRNTLEYDDEHLLRRNAIRRILKRRIGEGSHLELATRLLQELIWARYLPNGKIHASMIEKVAIVLEKYAFLFETLAPETQEGQKTYSWLLDVVSVEIEYVLGPPCVDEALASYAYQEIKKRVEWQSKMIREEDRDLQLYIALHRAVLKSNRPTLRYRVLTLYYPLWRKAVVGDNVVKEIAMNLSKVVDSVESQINHPLQDTVYRFVRRHAVVFHLLSDIAKDNPEACTKAIATGDTSAIDVAISKAAQARYFRFRTRLKRTVVRAAFFLLLTKSILAILVEYPYELLVLHTTDYLPLTVNILFPPFLLALIGVTVKVPQKDNTDKILSELHALLGVGNDFGLVFKRRKPWDKGAMWWIFNGLYTATLVITIGLIVCVLNNFNFNAFSIFFFIFFLSLVAYFGLRIRNSRRELLVADLSVGMLGTLADIIVLPIVRAGRWVALRAPKINVFLFFFDFIVEAPFKAAIGIVESWLAFLKEKREEV
jgi:hypothetical protein